VCEFLAGVPKETALYDKLAARGLKSFPDSPFFIHAGVIAEIRKRGPFRVNVRQIEPKLQNALAAARASSDPLESGLEPKIKESLAMVAELQSMPFRSFFGFGGPTIPKALADRLAEAGLMGDDFDDEDDDDGPAPGRRAAHSGAASPGPKPKKR
jgi:hypothetical protein